VVVREHNIFVIPSKDYTTWTLNLSPSLTLKPKFHLARHVTSRHDTTCSTCRALAFWPCRARRHARQDALDALDTSNVLCRDVTWRAKWNLGLTYYFSITSSRWRISSSRFNRQTEHQLFFPFLYFLAFILNSSDKNVTFVNNNTVCFTRWWLWIS